ncbi:lectin [Roseicella sp. DB1501]|uniref:lectin n=1 Tax=Roseicella sp. DB1501 TaxID=2730925 RepID=UPI001492B344|nr:lectin [Roseicella sp. DB1501]NOG72338.1 lectin [Roseicella sp. DB1501]
MTRLTLAAAALALAMPAAPALAQQPSPQMSFFITSANPGKGGDLGGLAGADAHCQALAQAAGAGNHRWHAYLSTQGDGAVNARDRIGRGPWRNAKGEVVADSLQELHDGAPKLTKQTALTERGAVVNGRGDTPNMHDILTGSQPDGAAFAAGEDRTCRNWTSGDAGSAMLGHSDRIGLNDSPPMKSWNSSHPSRGCNMEALKATGGAGLLYCFAAN